MTEDHHTATSNTQAISQHDTGTPAGAAYDVRPRNWWELFIEAVQLYGRNVRVFALISLLIAGPWAVLSMLSAINNYSDQAAQVLTRYLSNSPAASGARPAGQMLASLALTVLIALWAVLLPWLEGALSHAAIERLLGRGPGVRGSLRASLSRFSSLWGTTVIAELVMALPVILLAAASVFALGLIGLMSAAPTTGSGQLSDPMPMMVLSFCGIGYVFYLAYVVIIAIRWGFRIPAVIGEGLGAFDALGRSNALTSGHRLRLLGRMGLFAVFQGLVCDLPVLVLGALFLTLRLRSGAAWSSLGTLAYVAVGAVLQWLIWPLRSIFTTVNYLDVRMRKENLTSFSQAQPAEKSASSPAQPVIQSLAAVAAQPAPAAVAAAASAPAHSSAIITTAGKPYAPPTTPGQKIGLLFNRLRAEGTNPELLNELGMAYMEIGDLGGALDSLRRARALAPDDADIAFNLALLHRDRKDLDAAREMMQVYLRLETNPAEKMRIQNNPRYKDLV